MVCLFHLYNSTYLQDSTLACNFNKSLFVFQISAVIGSQQDLDTAVELADTIPRYSSLRLLLTQTAPPGPALPPGRLGEIFRPPNADTVSKSGNTVVSKSNRDLREIAVVVERNLKVYAEIHRCYGI